jgi:hypothetical protein
MLQRELANRCVVVPERTPFVALILKQVRIDRSDPHAVLACESRDRLRILAGFEIPQHMYRDGRAASREAMHVSRIAQLVPEIDRRRVLEEFSEARAGVGKAPRGGFDREGFERLTGAAELSGRHGDFELRIADRGLRIPQSPIRSPKSATCNCRGL